MTAFKLNIPIRKMNCLIVHFMLQSIARLDASSIQSLNYSMDSVLVSNEIRCISLFIFEFFGQLFTEN